MVLTNAQVQAFFTDNHQMGIPQATVDQLVHEGIATVSDLSDFDEKSLGQVAETLRKPGGRVPDPNPGAAPGATIPTPAFVFGAKSQRRLLVAMDLIKYYKTTGRDLTAANIQWDTVMHNFAIQWKALKDKKEDDIPDIPKITKALPVMKWTEAFKDFLSRVIGVRTIPLSYIIRDSVQRDPVVPPLAAGQPHSTLHGSVEMELVMRASHTHALYRQDNATLYHYLEEASRSTPFASSIKPYQRAKDGRGAWIAMTSQYAGKDKWEAELRKQEQVLHTRIWKGQSNFPLEGFVSQHRNAYVSLEACAEHVDYQLPNGHSRVGFLLEGIQNSDAQLQAAMAAVRGDTDPNGMRYNFELAAAHIIPADPVARKRQAGTKRGAGEISGLGAEIAGVEGANKKASIGKTGVHLRYYKFSEYKKLTKEQKDELREWRANNSGKGSKAGGKQPLTKKQISAIVADQVKAAMKTGDGGDDSANDPQAYITSLVVAALKDQQEKKGSGTAASVSASTAGKEPSKPTVTLQNILKNSKNTQRK